MAERKPDWLRNELASAGRENLDPAHVARYDAKMDSDAAQEVAFLQRLGMNPQSTVVELGAGTGQFAVAAARVCGRIIAVDVSPVMIEALRAKVRSAGLANVEVVEAGFLTYEHAGSRPNVIYSRFALHHLPDFWKALALDRMRRMLSYGGLLRLWDVVYHFDPRDAGSRIEAWCASGAGARDVETEWSRAELAEHVREEHSTFTWLLEPMIERSGFKIETAEYSPDGVTARYVARAS